MVVTDHHALPQQLPPADAVLDSAFEPEDSPSRYLCGAAMAFKLISALEQQAQGDDVQEMMLAQYGDLVAIATLADVVPLTGENRTLARMGLEILAQTQRPGLLALARAHGWPVTFYSAAELAQETGDFPPSDFVRKTTGVDNVCQRAAQRAGGTILIPKTICRGVTFAAAMGPVELTWET